MEKHVHSAMLARIKLYRALLFAIFVRPTQSLHLEALLTHHASATLGTREPMEQHVHSAAATNTRQHRGLHFARLVLPIRSLQLEVS
jgi:hypothetical protein